MRFVDEYRDPQKVMALIETLSVRAKALPCTPQRPLRIMEVCGGHTHAIFKFGLDRLPRAVKRRTRSNGRWSDFHKRLNAHLRRPAGLPTTRAEAPPLDA